VQDASGAKASTTIPKLDMTARHTTQPTVSLVGTHRPIDNRIRIDIRPLRRGCFLVGNLHNDATTPSCVHAHERTVVVVRCRFVVRERSVPTGTASLFIFFFVYPNHHVQPHTHTHAYTCTHMHTRTHHCSSTTRPFSYSL